MNTIALSPRLDLFRFEFPKDFLPIEVETKYQSMINKDKSVIISPIDYLNESVVGINIPGISDLTTEQQQHSWHPLSENRNKSNINVETERKNTTYSPNSILNSIENKFTIELRKNRGLYNYFMMYETLFYKVCKQYDKRAKDDLFQIYILSETGNVESKILLFQPRIQGIEGIQLKYNQLERQPETFNIDFVYNNIDFELV